ncbi:MAG: PhoH family protein [Burkholderiaceae bacterium]|nr:PhoH family protein [Burkholderiaceae bacterium]
MPLPPLPKKRGTILTDMTAVEPIPEPTVEVKEEAVVEKPVKKAPAKRASRAKKTETMPKTHDAVTDLAPCPPTTTAKHSTLGSHRRSKGKKLFVLDTNVLMHDPSSIFRFEEHDIFLPMVTLEELDAHKKGMSDVARNARQVSRSIDQLLGHSMNQIDEGIALNALGNTEAEGKLFFQTETLVAELPQGLPQGKADNQILSVVLALKGLEKERAVVLVSKDINMRIKATAMGLEAEDYFNDKTIDDTDMLYSGRMELPADFWETHGKQMESWKEDGQTLYRISGPLVSQMFVNLFVFLPDDSFMARVKKIEGKTATLCVVRDYMQSKHSVWGIHARNREQCFALNLMMDPEIDFVTLLGQAGTGKTLITLAAALSQTMDMRRFAEIIFTRATVSVGEEIGFLPGTEEEKMLPWMGALEDNLEVLNKIEGGNDWGRSAANDLIRSRIKVKSMSFMRGRTFLNKFVIIDEAQNLSPKQMKTLITRAGPGTKIVCLGNIAQIDTPYLTEGSSGLTYVVDRFKGWTHAGHVTLQRGERSRLADFATDAL